MNKFICKTIDKNLKFMYKTGSDLIYNSRIKYWIYNGSMKN